MNRFPKCKKYIFDCRQGALFLLFHLTRFFDKGAWSEREIQRLQTGATAIDCRLSRVPL